MAAPTVELRLVAEDGSIAPWDGQTRGELEARGPWVARAYLRPEDGSNEERFVDGWLRTGDIAAWDDDDYIAIVDRKKDMIIAGGFNVYPREIDEVLYQHPKIAEAAAVGIPDAYRGETVKAFVVLKEGQTATEKEVIEFCRQKLAAYKAPKLIEFRKDLPKSAVGKVLRKVLRDEELTKGKQK